MNTLAENPLVDDVGLLSKGFFSQAEIIPKSCAHKIGTLDGSICIQTGVFFRSRGDVQQKSEGAISIWKIRCNCHAGYAATGGAIFRMSRLRPRR